MEIDHHSKPEKVYSQCPAQAVSEGADGSLWSRRTAVCRSKMLTLFSLPSKLRGERAKHIECVGVLDPESVADIGNRDFPLDVWVGDL